MVIRPVLPDQKPDQSFPSLAPTLPFRKNSGFLDLLKATAKSQASAAQTNAVHKVEKGESLWRICEDALKAQGGVPSKTDVNRAVSAITRANGLKDANKLSVGQSVDLSAIATSRSPSPTATAPVAIPPLVSNVSAKSVTAAEELFKQVSAPILDNTVVQTPLAAQPTENADAKGGGLSLPRPLFTKLSNARPTARLAASRSEVAADTQAAVGAPTKSVDLTALMQSILEPGSVAVEEPVAGSPWSNLIGGVGRFTSGFGVRTDPFTGKPQFHPGIDIATTPGTEIFPYMPGTVTAVGRDAGYGNFVTVKHPNGLETMYAHASETLVKTGDVVLKDTPIAKVGTTGRSTGPHLHFEVHQNDKAIDPLPFVKDMSLNVAKAL